MAIFRLHGREQRPGYSLDLLHIVLYQPEQPNTPLPLGHAAQDTLGYLCGTNTGYIVALQDRDISYHSWFCSLHSCAMQDLRVQPHTLF
ncbi:hypothetical protein CEXT_181751 [Caerostris extrusa]|uniref:Uncharacterized protein n=1 Tax=Caerostris extrusa TaxID=172846 RepID=A0AAV4UW01_CAEEX|nr:hypothetical protein CEXT_181751 [Caerostris extrusa]